MKKFLSLMIMVLVFMSVTLVGCKNPAGNNVNNGSTFTITNATFEIDTLNGKQFYSAPNVLSFRSKNHNGHVDYVQIDGVNYDITEVYMDRIYFDDGTQFIRYINTEDAEYVLYNDKNYAYVGQI